MDGYDVINYRLAAIEQQLKELTQLLIKVPIMNNDIKDLTKRVATLESESKISKSDIQTTQTTIKTLEQKIENQPLKEKANKWEVTINILYKLFITACATIVLCKIGLKI